MIAFDAPFVLYAAPIFALTVAFLALWARRTRVRHAAAWSSALAVVASKTGRRGSVVLAVATLAAATALAGPRFGRRTVTTETKALNLVIAVDISRSMLAEDVPPSRLARAQQQIHRLIQDLRNDRIGLIAFSGRSFILSPLTIDAGALHLLVDGLDPDISSSGGTEFAAVLNQGRGLLLAGGGVADRVLVVFTDGEAHDSLARVLEAADQVRREGIHLVLVAEGSNEGARIPVRDPDGILLGYQRDPDDRIVETRRRDDVLSDIADAAQGALVPAQLGDQAEAVRDLVNAFKRSPEAMTTAAQDVSRAWVPVLVAALVLLAHTLSRRTAALAVVAFLLLAPSRASAQGIPNRGDAAWRAGAFRQAAELYLEQVQMGEGGDTAWLNLGTAALAAGDSTLSRQALSRASRSIDPDLRFRALYNLGFMALELAEADSLNMESHLAHARRSYREALLLKPGHADAKWNYELALRLTPPAPSGGQQPQPPSGGQGENEEETRSQQELTLAQAEQILNSMLEEERRTRADLNRRRKRAQDRRGRRDW